MPDNCPETFTWIRGSSYRPSPIGPGGVRGGEIGGGEIGGGVEMADDGGVSTVTFISVAVTTAGGAVASRSSSDCSR